MKNLYICIICILFMGCSKKEFLEAKPDQALVVPQSLEDLQAIVDNTALFNGEAGVFTTSGITPVLGETASDDYFFGRPNLYETMSPFIKHAYTWNKEDAFAGIGNISDWTQPYKGILYANLVLEQWSKLPETDQQLDQGKWIKGTALFHRAHLYYQLAQVFAPVYQKTIANEVPGLPLRLTGDVGEALHRNSLEETYKQMLSDLHEALNYLPEKVPYFTRPTIVAGYALLARVYLSMSDYSNALIYSNKTLELNSFLMDFNNLDSLSSFPIPRYNQEIIFSCLMSLGGGITMPVSNSLASVDTLLVDSFLEGDLRKSIFFSPRIESQSVGMKFKGSYHEATNYFTGLACNEVYLIKAECLTRIGLVKEACEVMNVLLKNRFEENKFQAISIVDPNKLLKIVLDERRKELLFRGLRWTDLRRLNLDQRFAVVIKRFINNEWFELLPNDSRYTFPIPDDVIGFHLDMQQNLR